jgi:positive regulator of sigma E activity
MMLEHPERLLILATVLLLFGVIMPFLMVIHVVESTFFLNFLSFTASILGSLLGFVGIALYQIRRRHKDDSDDSDYK